MSASAAVVRIALDYIKAITRRHPESFFVPTAEFSRPKCRKLAGFAERPNGCRA